MSQNNSTGSGPVNKSEMKRLLKQFLDGSRLPTISDIGEDLECDICKQAYLTGENPEFPIKLGNCGHIVGLNCALHWLSPMSPEGKNSCWCRKPVFEDWNANDYRSSMPAASTATVWYNLSDHISDAQLLEMRHRAARVSHIWYQFQEGVVRTVEDADNPMAMAQIPIAEMVIRNETLANTTWKIGRMEVKSANISGRRFPRSTAS